MNDFNKLNDLDNILEKEFYEDEEALIDELEVSENEELFDMGITENDNKEDLFEVLNIDELYLLIEEKLKRTCLEKANVSLLMNIILIFSIGSIIENLTEIGFIPFYIMLFLTVINYGFKYRNACTQFNRQVENGLLTPAVLKIIKNTYPESLKNVHTVTGAELDDNYVCPLGNQFIFETSDFKENITDELSKKNLKEQLKYIDALILKI